MTDEQLDLFTTETEPDEHKEPAPDRVLQLTELPGETFEDIFA